MVKRIKSFYIVMCVAGIFLGIFGSGVASAMKRGEGNSRPQDTNNNNSSARLQGVPRGPANTPGTALGSGSIMSQSGVSENNNNNAVLSGLIHSNQRLR